MKNNHKKKLNRFFVNSAFLISTPLLAMSSCGEQIIEDTRQLPGSKLKNAQPGQAEVAAPGTPENNGPQEIVLTSASPAPTTSAVSSTPPSTAPAQSPAATPSAEPEQSATPKPAKWEPENIYRIVEEKCISCHTHRDFTDKAYFLQLKNRSIHRITKTPTDPMPPLANAPGFSSSEDGKTLVDWLTQQ